MFHHRPNHKGGSMGFFDEEGRGFVPPPEQNPREYTYVSGYGFAPPPRHVTEGWLIRSYSSALGLAILLYLFLSATLPQVLLGLAPFLSWVWGGSIHLVTAQILSGVSYTIALALPFLAYCRYIGIPLELAFPLKKPNWQLALPAIPITLGVTVVGAVASAVLRTLLSHMGFLPIMPDLSLPYSGVGVLFYIITRAVLPALLEELVFRGAVMQSLRRFGDGFALLCSAILFAIVHGNLVQLPSALLAGLAIGYFVLLTGSLWTGVVIHLCNNLITILVSLLVRGTGPNTQLLVTCGVYILYVVVGLVCLMLLLRSHGGLFTFPPANTVTREGKKYRLFFTSVGMVAAIFILCSIASRYFIVL